MTLRKLNHALAGVLVMSGAMGLATQAHALSLGPLDANWTSIVTSNFTQVQVEGIVGVSPLGLVYKQDQGGPESGNGAGYYTTTFSYESTGDASGATITWDGPMLVSCGNCFLIVKDGNHDSENPPPYPQYIYNISGWNGTDAIYLSGFWPGAGSISNIAIWNNYSTEDGGGNVAMVPEADTYAMLLAGLGLVGFAARRKFGKTL